MNKLKYLNLGCGSTFHKDWINIDFYSSSKDIISYNLLKKIPFPNDYFEAVYHSHVLEHFSKTESEKFIKECYRVLKKDGVIRVVVPDLEQIAIHYVNCLNSALDETENAEENYDWIMLEMYDQAVRNFSGGEMLLFLKQKIIRNEDFIYSRIGLSGKNLRENFLKIQSHTSLGKIKLFIGKVNEFLSFNLKNKCSILKELCIGNLLFGKSRKYYKTGLFRSNGEIHQWMYDRFSLGRLLKKSGFYNVEVKTAFESNIPNWKAFELDSKNGIILRPDSLFIEAIK